MKTKFGTPISLSLTAIALVACGAGRTPEAFRDDTQKLFEEQKAPITACYATALGKNPEAKGLVTVSFLIENDTGKVKRVKVDKDRTTAPASLQKCVTESITDMRLAPPDAQDGKGTFSWDFTAKPAPAAPAPAEAAPSAAPGS